MADSGNATLPTYERAILPQATMPAYPREPTLPWKSLDFPSDLELYRPSFPDFLICSPIDNTSTKVRQISYASVKLGKDTKGTRPVPAIKLHAGPDPNSTVIADVKFNTSPSTDITVYHSPELGTSSEASHHKLSHEGVITKDVHTFVMPTRGGRVAKFEWLHSGTKEVSDLATSNIGKENFSQSNHGLKLVMAKGDDDRSSDEKKALAVYSGGTRSGALNPRKIAGKLRFLEENIDVDDIDSFKLIVVLTILSMMERGRQHAMKNSEWFCVVS